MRIYEMTGGDNWTDNSEWERSVGEAWYGVTALGGHVTGLSLEINNLVGELAIADVFPDLPYLESIQIGGNVSLEVVGNVGDFSPQMTDIGFSACTNTALGGRLMDLPHSLETIDLGYTKSYLTGATSDIPSSVTSLDFALSECVVSGPIGDLPPGMLSIILALTESAITGATDEFPGSIEVVNLVSTNSVIVAGGFGVSSLPDTLIALSLNNTASTFTITNGNIPYRLYRLDYANTLGYAASDLAAIPSALCWYDLSGNPGGQIWCGATPFVATGIKMINIRNCGTTEDEVGTDSIINRIYADREIFTFLMPTLDIVGCPTASGTYQFAEVPSTPQEKIYALERGGGFNAWKINQ